MPNINEGLSVGGETPEKAEGTISSTEDFMASLRKDLGVPEETEPPAATVPVTTGETVVEATTQTPDDVTLTPEQKELKELHALLGRQSAELGELRKKVDAPPPVEETTYQAPPPITDDLVDEIEAAVLKNGGENVAVWALTNRPDLYETVLDSWSDSGLPGAARRAAAFDLRYQNALQAEIATAEAAEATEFQKGLAEALDAQVATLAPEYGVPVETDADQKVLADILGSAPKSVQKLVVSKDASEREDGLRIVLQLAATKPATTPVTPEDAAALAAARERAKAGAGVGTGGLQRAAPAQAKDDGEKPDFLDAFQKALLETPNTSVSAGLTFGNK